MRLHALVSILPVVFAAPSLKRDEPAPVIIPDVEGLIANKYIVKLKDGPTILDDTLSALSIDPKHTYSNVFNGFSATLDKKALEKLRNQPGVEYIEQDSRVSINSYITQKPAQYSLGRLSSRKTVKDQYTYDSTAGSGTCVYIVDTGVEDTHPEFQGRAKQLKSFIPGEDVDYNGHGTHVAGTVGSKTYGVAKKAKIFGVKVLDNYGYGEWSSIIAGFDYVVKDSAARKSSCPKGFFVNVSIGGGKTDAVNAAAAAMVNKGLFVGVAAGNSGDDASYYSPASEPNVCTVGAISKGPVIAPYSNYGSLVDIFAVGTDVESTWIFGSTNIISGTSMATPHVVGLAAYFASKTGKPHGLCTRMRNVATNGIIRGLPAGTVNKIAFNDYPGGR